MCNIIAKSLKQNIIGYKVALKINNKFYSPVTGIEYKIGNVEIPTKYGENNIKDDLYMNDVLNPNDFAHDPAYAGKTAIFEVEQDGLYKLDEWKGRLSQKLSNKLQLIRMALSGDLYTGDYGLSSVYLGTAIDSIEENF
jgi:hypothetical protein